jgi:hypothetical protein
MRKNVIILASLMLALASCKDPSKYYHGVIKEAGFIPYKVPVSDTRPGALFSSSTPDNLLFAGMHDECFPSNSLRHTRDVDIPASVKSLSFSSSVDTKFFDEVGNEVFTLKTESSRVKEIALEMDGVKFEGMSFRRLGRFFKAEMDLYCQEDLLSGDFYFLLGAMKVDSMKFTFKNNANLNIKLNADNLADFIDLDSEAKWEIKNEYTLVVKTPKYIGYHMGKIRSQENGELILSIATASKHTTQEYHFEDVYTIRGRSKSIGAGEWVGGSSELFSLYE